MVDLQSMVDNMKSDLYIVYNDTSRRINKVSI
jgi:hypothetical protein